MSFILEYRRFMRVSVKDDNGDLVDAVNFKPSPATTRRLRDHQIVFRPHQGRIELFYRRNPAAIEPLLGEIAERVTFSFGVHDRGGTLLTRYEPGLSRESGSQLYFDNLTNEGKIQSGTRLTLGTVVEARDATRVLPEVFTLKARVGDVPPTSYAIRHKFDPTRKNDVPIVADKSQEEVLTRVDMSSLSDGPYTVRVDGTHGHTRMIYKTTEMVANAVLGVVDLHWESRQDAVPADGTDYEIRFKKR